MSRRLNSRSKGLLEVVRRELTTGSKQLLYSRVEYLHRTVRDYVETPEIKRRFSSYIKRPFDPYLKLCAADLAVCKTLDLEFCNFRANRAKKICFWIYFADSLWNASKISPENTNHMKKLIDVLNRTLSDRKLVRHPSSAWETQDDQCSCAVGNWFVNRQDIEPILDFPAAGHFLSRDQPFASS